ncbi:DUF6199 family natural product biosynthesis protein [Paenibacillus chitinolyticus]|uniref:DUF6199 family natural product biosynthesis protein n=1 Tax=Paenibacillus chitinolyticus TaxID=79263 RepID=UPI002DBE2899|nr:DUF6199 family natural product biosynthesis protein [Paenibacillus chitinolyticus]
MVLIAVGLLMLLAPGTIWTVKESWKSNDGTEPSDLYLLSTRLGGGVLLLVGIACIVVSWL